MLLSVEQFWLSGWSPLITLGLSDALGVSDGFSLSTSLTAQASFSLADVFVSSFGKQLADTALVRDHFSREWSISITREETISLQDVLGKHYTSSFADGVNNEDGFGPAQAVLRVADSVSSFDDLAAASAFYRDIAQAINTSAANHFNLSFEAASSVAIEDALAATLYRQLFDALSSEVSLSSEAAFYLTTNLADLLGIASDLRADVSRVISDTISVLDGAINKEMTFTAVDSLLVGDVLDVFVDVAEDFEVFVEDTLSMVDSLSRAMEKVASSVLLLADTPLSSWFVLVSFKNSLYRASVESAAPGSLVTGEKPATSVLLDAPTTLPTAVGYFAALTLDVPLAKVRVP